MRDTLDMFYLRAIFMRMARNSVHSFKTGLHSANTYYVLRKVAEALTRPILKLEMRSLQFWKWQRKVEGAFSLAFFDLGKF